MATRSRKPDRVYKYINEDTITKIVLIIFIFDIIYLLSYMYFSFININLLYLNMIFRLKWKKVLSQQSEEGRGVTCDAFVIRMRHEHSRFLRLYGRGVTKTTLN